MSFIIQRLLHSPKLSRGHNTCLCGLIVTWCMDRKDILAFQAMDFRWWCDCRDEWVTCHMAWERLVDFWYWQFFWPGSMWSYTVCFSWYNISYDKMRLRWNLCFHPFQLHFVEWSHPNILNHFEVHFCEFWRDAWFSC